MAKTNEELEAAVADLETRLHAIEILIFPQGVKIVEDEGDEKEERKKPPKKDK